MAIFKFNEPTKHIKFAHHFSAVRYTMSSTRTHARTRSNSAIVGRSGTQQSKRSITAKFLSSTTFDIDALCQHDAGWEILVTWWWTAKFSASVAGTMNEAVSYASLKVEAVILPEALLWWLLQEASTAILTLSGRVCTMLWISSTMAISRQVQFHKVCCRIAVQSVTFWAEQKNAYHSNVRSFWERNMIYCTILSIFGWDRYHIHS